VESKSRDERDEFRRKLKNEWKLIWTERFDDRLKAEGIAVRDYPLLFTDRGFVLFASRATKIPSHIAGPVTPVVAWIKKVSQRNAPGAMRAMAFIVRPVRPRVGFISTGASAI